MENIEVLEGLERQVYFSVSGAELARRSAARLAKVARTATMPGFRPGKVPMRLVESMHGRSTRLEVLSELLRQAFEGIVESQRIAIVGDPQIEPVGDAVPHLDTAERGDRQLQVETPALSGTPDLHFRAKFEVFPDVRCEGIEELDIEAVQVSIGEAEMDQTIEVLRRQRADWVASDAPSVVGDRLVIDFTGTLDGQPFEGGSAEAYSVELGSGSMVEDFDRGLLDRRAGDSFDMPVRFPEGYPAPLLAGKTASFHVAVRDLVKPVLPAVDDHFARALGIEDGDLEKMRASVRSNLEREVKQRLRERTKVQVMDRLATLAQFEVPRALVDTEAQGLLDRARADMERRGYGEDNITWSAERFVPAARERLRLGLFVDKLVSQYNLRFRPSQVRRLLEEFAAAFENPEEVIRATMMDRSRLSRFEALATEENVVDFVLSRARVTNREIPFQELMPQAVRA